MAITIQNQYKTVPFNMGLLNPYVLPPFLLKGGQNLRRSGDPPWHEPIERMAASHTLRMGFVKSTCLHMEFVKYACLRIKYASLRTGLI
jgi:hypothetical protein